MDVITKLKSLRIVAAVLRADMDGLATRKQVMRLQIVFKSQVSSREERIQVLSSIIDREVSSFNELSSGEASALLDDPFLYEIIEYVRGQFGYA